MVGKRADAERRYALVRLGVAEFAFTSYDNYFRALGRMWAAGLVPEPLPSVRGADLARAAPNLKAVDPDLTDLPASDLEWLARHTQ